MGGVCGCEGLVLVVVSERVGVSEWVMFVVMLWGMMFGNMGVVKLCVFFQCFDLCF